MRRVILGIPLALGLAVFAFTSGGVVAAAVAAPNGDAFTATASVALIAFIAAMLALIGGVYLAIRLDSRRLIPAAAISLTLAAVSVTLLASRRARSATAAGDAAAASAEAGFTPRPVTASSVPDSLIGLLVLSPDSLARFETREFGYEESGASVYERAGARFRLRLKSGEPEWVQPAGAAQFLALNELLRNRLNYLTSSWDGQIRDGAGSMAPVRAVTLKGERPAEVPASVLETRVADGTLWLKVEIFDRSPCSGGDPESLATGWIPAWGIDRQPTAWFFSRGC